MRHLVIVASFVSALGLIAASPARADLAPPPGYVETCTIENHEKDGTQKCSACSTYFREPDKCQALMKPHGYKKMCRAGGASTWTEVWCKARADMVPGEPEPNDLDGNPEPVDKPTEPNKPVEPNRPTRQDETETRDTPATPQNEAGPAEVRGADVAPRRDGKCGAGGAGLGWPLLAALGLLVRKRL